MLPAGLLPLALCLIGVIKSAGAGLPRRFDFREGERGSAQWTHNRRLAAVTAVTASSASSSSSFPVTDVCYEGCFAAPASNPWATPLPVMLARGPYGTPMPLLDCSRLAWAAGLPYFAIVDEIDCYGGNASVSGWPADDSCDLGCLPGATWPISCGGNRKASVFSLGECVFDEASCDSGPRSPSWPSSPQRPVLPPAQPPSPSPPPRAPRTLRCRDDGVALWGEQLPRVKLNLKNNRTTNTALCLSRCTANPACQGFYFKTDNYCHQFSRVNSFTGKRYRSVVRACKLMTVAAG